MKLPVRAIKIGGSLLGLVILSGILFRACAPEKPMGEGREGVPLAAVEQGVARVLSDMATEKAQREAEQQAAIVQSARSQSHSQILGSLFSFQNLYEAIDCNRVDDLRATILTEQKETGKSYYLILSEKLTWVSGELNRWAIDQKAALSGDAEQIALSRALIGDAVALLLLTNQEMTNTANNACPRSASTQVVELQRAVTAVLADLDTQMSAMSREDALVSFQTMSALYETAPSDFLAQQIKALAENYDFDMNDLNLEEGEQDEKL